MHHLCRDAKFTRGRRTARMNSSPRLCYPGGYPREFSNCLAGGVSLLNQLKSSPGFAGVARKSLTSTRVIMLQAEGR